MIRQYTIAFLLVLSSPLWILAQNPGAGGCIFFDGTSHYIAVPHSNSLNSATALTLEAWILPGSFGSNNYDNVIIGKDGWGNGPQGYTLRCGGNGALSFNFGTGIGWQEVVVPNVLQTQTWHHVAATFDGSVMRLYVNGMQVGTTNYTGSISSGTYDLNIGRIPYTLTGPRHFSGELDEIRVWRTALSQSTIRDWMCRKVTATHPAWSQLGGYWRFDDGTGNTLPDLSPNTNNGTLVNGPIWGLSGAAIGDSSMHAYGGPISLNMPGVSGGSFLLDNVSGTPNGMQLYRVDEAPDLANLPAGYSSFDSSYYGVWIVSNSSHTFDVTLDYGPNPYIGPNEGCVAALGGRIANNSAVWYNISVTRDLAQNRITRAGIGQQQFILGRAPQPYPLVALSHVAFCDGDTAELSTNPVNGATFSWYRDGVLIPGAAAINYFATQSGNYYVTVSDSLCSYNTDTITVTEFPLPMVSQTPLGGVCIGAGLQSLAGAPSGGTFSGVGVSSGQFDPILAGLGNSEVYYSYTDSNMCVGVDTQMVAVYADPSAVFPNPNDVCENDASFPLTVANPPGGTYSGPGVSANDFFPSSVGVGSFPLQYVIVDSNGCTDTANASIVVHANPAAPSITLVGNTLTSSASTGNQWQLNGNDIPGANSDTYQPTMTGTYTVIVIDSNGCPSDPSMGILFVGVDDLQALQWDFYPNPVSSDLNVEWAGDPGTRYELELRDLQGRLLWREEGTVFGSEQRRRVPMEELSGGIYFVHLRSGDTRAVGKVQR
jgi:hypothetical protein